jgi:magnesium chelatase family protein
VTVAVVYSRGSIGMDAPLVTVEVHVQSGLPRCTMVGLPEVAVKESKDRVRSALISSGFSFPDRRITVNLAPATLPKYGGRFDLAIALGILVASGQLPAAALAAHEFLGELALSGQLRPVNASISAMLAAERCQRTMILPRPEIRVGVNLSGHLVARHVREVCAYLQQQHDLLPLVMEDSVTQCVQVACDLAELTGQDHARAALEIAAAGGHHLLMVGAPGVGKSYLAQCFAGILPERTPKVMLEALMVADLCTHGRDQQVSLPFRVVHHSATAPALVGGGQPPGPGAISLAHGGVLFLDELPHFSPSVLDALREPMERGVITINRARHSVVFPCCFQLIAAMNPCPCGYWGISGRSCRCSLEQVKRYQGRISGPLLDRIDLMVRVDLVDGGALLAERWHQAESSLDVRARVIAAHKRQLVRSGVPNRLLSGKALQAVCGLSSGARKRLIVAADRFELSTRGLFRVLRVARTIADLAAVEHVTWDHLTQALGYRVLWCC